jgi:two-component system, OmpR family, copper resistance phosphate regulon response regulator CusR
MRTDVKILIAEDEKKVASFVKRGLQEEGYVVDLASNGEDGLELALGTPYDLIILDIYMPRLDGLTVLRKLREEKIRTPVLLLTVRAAIEDKVLGLDSGADDYLTKPFAFQELLARVRALLRRQTESGTNVLRVGDLSLDSVRRAVMRGTQRIDLSLKEFSLLEYFMQNAGRVLTRTMIIDHVWNYDFDNETNVVDVYVNYLRRKIDTGYEPKLIHTIRGVGYVLKAD